MIDNEIALYYLAFINILSGLLFALDKSAARNGRKRISERTLHWLELAGGVFLNLILMYILRHKNKKFSYWIWTWIIMAGWGSVIIIFRHLINYSL